MKPTPHHFLAILFIFLTIGRDQAAAGNLPGADSGGGSPGALSHPAAAAGEESQVDEGFQEIVRQTEEVRGLKFKQPVQLKRLSKEELRAILEKEMNRLYEDEDWKNVQTSLSLIGALQSEKPLKEILFQMMGEQVAGLYDPHTKGMYIVGDLSLKTGISKIVLEHELTHALTDQHFDLLSLPIENVNNDDQALAALAIVEGDATLSMIQYAQGFEAGDALFTLVASLFMDQETFYRAPLFLQAWLTFPYIGGEMFLLELMKSQGGERSAFEEELDFLSEDPLINWEIVDYLYEHPPVSTEQILHPEKFWLDPDVPTPLNLAEEARALEEAGWRAVWENTLGEFLMKTWMGDHLRALQAMRAAEGWDGDRYGLFRDSGGNEFLYWRTAWDSESDAEEFSEACGKLKEKGGFGGEVRVSNRGSSPPHEVVLWLAKEEETFLKIEGILKR